MFNGILFNTFLKFLGNELWSVIGYQQFGQTMLGKNQSQLIKSFA